MSELVALMENLVAVSAKSAKDRELGPAVEAVMTAFDPEDLKATRAALRVLDAGLTKAKGRGAQVLHLALGALVEAGAPPELAWPSAERGLLATIASANRYASACYDACDTPDIGEAVKEAGATVGAAKPRELASWEALPSRCLAAVACLTRSPALRKKVQKSDAYVKAVYPLEETVEAVGFLSHAVRIIPDQHFLVIHPEQRRGFRLFVHEVTTNVELFIYITDLVVGDPDKGLIKGPRPSARSVAMLKNPDKAPDTPLDVHAPWGFVNWTGLAEDGTLPKAGDNTEHWAWYEGVPADIKEFGRERVLLMQKPTMNHQLELEPAFDALTPTVKVVAKLSGAEVDRVLLKMGKEAAKLAAKSRKSLQKLQLARV